MVICCFVLKYTQELARPVEQILQTYNYGRLKLGKLSIIRISKVKSGYVVQRDAQNAELRIPYFSGRIFFKIPIDNFDYAVAADLTETVNDLPNASLSKSLHFIIFPGMKLVLFFERKLSDRYGRKILSQVLFNDKKHLQEVNFNPTRILDAHRQGRFAGMWFNGVRGAGRITATNQYGTDFANDPQFANMASRYGFGVEIPNGLLAGKKIAVFESGVLNCLAVFPDFDSEIKARLSMLQIFLPFS